MLHLSTLALLLLPSSILAANPAPAAASAGKTTATPIASASIPANPSAPKVTGLIPSKQAALNEYLSSIRKKPGFKSVQTEVSIVLPAASLQAQEASFRNQVATATGTVVPVPPYVSGMPPNAQTYLSSYYAAQASILNKNFAPQPSDTARAQLGEQVTTAVVKISASAPLSGKQNSTTIANPITTSTKSDTSTKTAGDHKTTGKPSDKPSGTAGAASSTAKSSSSSGVAAGSQPTGGVVNAAAGVVAAGMMGVAALL